MSLGSSIIYDLLYWWRLVAPINETANIALATRFGTYRYPVIFQVTHAVSVGEMIASAVIEANSPALFTGHSNVSNVCAVKVAVGPPFNAAVARLPFISVDQHRRNNNNQQQ
jgi:hypothetical protein